MILYLQIGGTKYKYASNLSILIIISNLENNSSTIWGHTIHYGARVAPSVVVQALKAIVKLRSGSLNCKGLYRWLFSRSFPVNG